MIQEHAIHCYFAAILNHIPKRVRHWVDLGYQTEIIAPKVMIGKNKGARRRPQHLSGGKVVRGWHLYEHIAVDRQLSTLNCPFVRHNHAARPRVVSPLLFSHHQTETNCRHRRGGALFLYSCFRTLREYQGRVEYRRSSARNLHFQNGS